MNSADRARGVASAICGGVFLVVFEFFGNAVQGYIDTSSVFYWWVYQWWNPGSDTEHGWLILGLSVWLFVRNLRRKTPVLEQGAGSTAQDKAPDSKAQTRNLRIALGAMLAGLALHGLGFAAQQTRLSILAFLLVTWGVLRLGGGRRWGAAAAFPLGFMVFSIPVNVLDSLGFWLRMGVVDASAALAHAMGIGVMKSGTQLVAPDGRYHYDVAAACSGIRSLTAMVALSLLAGYLNFRSYRRRALVLLLCFPLVYLGNVARIVAIILAAQLGGPKWGDVAHEVMGFGVFVIVLGGVLAAIAAIRRWWPEKDQGPRTRDQGPATESGLSGGCERQRVAGDPQSTRPFDEPLGSLPRGWRSQLRTAPALVAATVVVIAVGEMAFLHHLASLPARGEVGVVLAADGTDPAELPAFIGTEWIGRRAEVSPVEREILPADTGFSRKLYVPVADPQRSVLLSIVLSGRDRTSIHRPELCLVGQGWTITGSGEHRFQGGPGGSFPATLLRVRREVPTARGTTTLPQLTAYWFIGGDDVVATHWQRVARDSWNRVVHARADRWAYVLMQTDARDGEAAALARMQAVLDGTLRVFVAPRHPRALVRPEKS